MAEIALRSATEVDFPAIRRLIWAVGINPTGLAWRRFVVAVDRSGRVVGCGQLKPHAGGVVEMASIAVESAFRQRGIAGAIIHYLISKAPRPLYLTCRGRLGPFYAKWGFRSLNSAEMPVYFRRLARIASLLSAVLRDEGLLVMMLQ